MALHYWWPQQKCFTFKRKGRKLKKVPLLLRSGTTQSAGYLRSTDVYLCRLLIDAEAPLYLSNVCEKKEKRQWAGDGNLFGENLGRVRFPTAEGSAFTESFGTSVVWM